MAQPANIHPISLLTGNPITYYPGDGELLGKGIAGSVYRYQTSEGPIALKIIHYIDDSTTISTAAIREIASMINLDHPNVLPLLDVFFIENAIVLAFPLAEGTIRNVRTWPLSKDAYYKLQKAMFFQIVRGVVYLHSKDIHHGDLKPENILFIRKVTPDNLVIPKIADFGLARSAQCFARGDEMMAMTLNYRAPELLLGGKYSDATDTWALGCIYYEMLARRSLFTEYFEDEMTKEIIRKFGPLNETTWPGVTLLPRWNEDYSKIVPSVGAFPLINDSSTLKILNSLLQLNPQKRISLPDLMADAYFDDVRNEVISVPPLTSLDCQVALLTNIMPSPIGLHLTLRLRKLLYKWMMEIQQEFQRSDRCIALAIALFERYIATIYPPRDQWQGYEIISVIIASFIDPTYMNIDDAFEYTAKRYAEETLIQMERDVLTVCGLNSYAATSYDIMRVYLDYYPEAVRDVALTLYQLSYFTTLSNTYEYQEIALVCIEMGCLFAKVPFQQRSNPDMIRQFKSDINNMKDRDEIYDLVKRGTFLTKEIVGRL